MWKCKPTSSTKTHRVHKIGDPEVRHNDINITKLHHDHVAHKNFTNRLCCNACITSMLNYIPPYLLATTRTLPGNKFEFLFYVNVINKNGAMPI